jgi:DNA-3-methyladenine glycosylase
MKLNYSFYNRHVVDVAKDLLGKTFVFGNYQGIITETEAYRGDDDEASHAFKGPTPRSAIMFGEPGYSYVYMIYGMYFCLNIVCEEKGQGAAVLIRGLKNITGPGKLCRELGITKEHQGINLCESELMYLKNGIIIESYKETPRIGITKATDKLWRFVYL